MIALHYGSGYKLRCPDSLPVLARRSWGSNMISPFSKNLYLASFCWPGLPFSQDLDSISSKNGWNELKFCMDTIVVKCKWCINFGGNYFQVISHFLSFCQIFVNYSKHFLNPWHSLTYFAEPCCAFPHLEIPWLVYLAVYWHTLIHPDTTWLSLPSLAQAYQTLPAMEKWLRRPYTMTSTSHPNKNITNYFFISESPFPCWLLMDLTAVNCLLRFSCNTSV